MKGCQMILFGKTNGKVIPESMNKRIKAFIHKKYEKGTSIETLKVLILEAFERDNIKGSFTIIQDGVKVLNVGN
ncbi:hypothetical protein HMPREF2085_00303 [Fusobacterium nucleatum 13_3C]|jgi:hypothetical protein|nr:hypothetical protein HMPREF2085_00303 [Fusobacterium nucleatum 13_3C]